MKYYIYRVLFEEVAGLDRKKIVIDYLPSPVDDGSMLIVFCSKTLQMLGVYKKSGKSLLETKPLEGSLKDHYGRLSVLPVVTNRAYKFFAKKLREIPKNDFDILAGSL